MILPGMSIQPVSLSADAVAASFAGFAEEYTVTCFDRREEMPANYTVEEMAEDVAVCMRALGIAGADVFGTSQGGMMTLSLAARHPALVRKAVLGSAHARGCESFFAWMRRWLGFAEAGDRVSLHRDFTRAVYSEQTQKQFAAFFAATENTGTREELAQFAVQARASLAFDGAALPAKVTCPILVMAAEGDRVIPWQYGKEIADGAAGRAFYLYGKEYGHAVYDEAPDYRDRMLKFLHAEE